MHQTAKKSGRKIFWRTELVRKIPESRQRNEAGQRPFEGV